MNQQPTTRTNQLHDGFRRALDVLIAQAPGTQAEILHALSDASRLFAQQGRLQRFTKSESQLASHLMILGVGQLLTQAPKVKPLGESVADNSPRDSLGFTLHAPSFGTTRSCDESRERQQAAQPGAASLSEHGAQTARRSSESESSRSHISTCAAR